MENNNWIRPTKKSIKDSVSSLVAGETDYEKTIELIEGGYVKKIPKSYFLNIENFEPYTINDLNDPLLDKRVKRILKGFKDNSIPMVLAIEDENGKPDVYDGFTRAGVAIGLNLPIYAVVVPKEQLDLANKPKRQIKRKP